MNVTNVNIFYFKDYLYLVHFLQPTNSSLFEFKNAQLPLSFIKDI